MPVSFAAFLNVSIYPPSLLYILMTILHGLAVLATMMSGHRATDMTSLTTWVTANPQLKGSVFILWVVYSNDG